MSAAAGRAPARQVPPVLLLHGLMGTSRAHFGAQMRAWAGRRRLYAIDLPGHGGCPADAVPDYFVEVTGWLCRALDGKGPLDVIAASYLGGTIAIQVARSRPELFSSLVLTGYTTQVPRASFLAWAQSFLDLAHSSPALAQAYERLHGSRWRETLARVTADCRTSFESHVEVDWPTVEGLPFPVLLVNGDVKENERKAARRYADRPGALAARVIEGAGHLVPVDKPGEFIAAVEQFWSDEAARGRR